MKATALTVRHVSAAEMTHVPNLRCRALTHVRGWQVARLVHQNAAEIWPVSARKRHLLGFFPLTAVPTWQAYFSHQDSSYSANTVAH